MAERVALAVAAHPDDIEFAMAGTLVCLGERGWQLHYMNVANGSCGSVVEDPQVIAARRANEAREAASVLGATWHPPLCNDLEIAYCNEQIGRLCSLIRRIRPGIILTHSPQDYMEDHTITCRIVVTAAFCRGIRNYPVHPEMRPITDDVTVYHAMPHGLRGPLRQRITAGQHVDTTAVLDTKRRALCCHHSQREWLDASQGIGNYITSMEEFSREMGLQCGAFEHAEGWRRHAHLGFSSEDDDPLLRALGRDCRINDEYERMLG